MQWIAPSEKDTGTETLENRLWAAADELRANSGLTSAQYSQPVLGLIFLRFAEVRFLVRRAVLEKQAAGGRRGSRVDDPTAYQAEGILYLTPPARFDHIVRLPEGSDAGKAVNEAMRDIEAKNPQLAGVLPRTYQIFDSTLLQNLLKKVSEIPATAEGDMFGRIYEYFLGEFARAEGSRGGEFYTPISIVRLLVEVLEPFHGRILDPACGSGGMFVQSARFVAEHKHSPATELAIHGQEKIADTVKLCRMNLAIHGLEGDIREGISYYDDLHTATGQFESYRVSRRPHFLGGWGLWDVQVGFLRRCASVPFGWSRSTGRPTPQRGRCCSRWHRSSAARRRRCGSGCGRRRALLHEGPARVGRRGPHFSGSSAGATLQG